MGANPTMHSLRKFKEVDSVNTFQSLPNRLILASFNCLATHYKAKKSGYYSEHNRLLPESGRIILKDAVQKFFASLNEQHPLTM